MFLALDQSLNVSGWAIFNNNQIVNCGTFTIKANLPIEQRLSNIWKELNSLYAEYNFTFLVFEDIQYQSNIQTYKKLCYVHSVLLLWCYFNDIKYRIYTPSSWRAVLGKGWGKKREEQKQYAINYVKEEYDKKVVSDVADAICIGTAYIKDISNESAF